MVNKTADCFNNVVLVVKISRKNLLKKWKTTQRRKRSYNRNAKLLRLVGATFYSKVASLKRMMKKNLIILKSFQKKSLSFIVLFVFSLFTFKLSNINWKCSKHIYMLTEHTYDSAVFEIFLNIITIYLLLNNN